MPSISTALLTAEEFFAGYSEQRAELVQGVVVEETGMPSYRHGEVCAEFIRQLGNFVKPRGLGKVFGNDSLVRLTRDPDTVRGPDVCFVSAARMPGPAPEGVSDIVPDFVVEVRSPSNTWATLQAKAAEFLAAGATAVALVDHEAAAITVLRRGELPQTFDNGDDFVLPDALPGFRAPVRGFFE